MKLKIFLLSIIILISVSAFSQVAPESAEKVMDNAYKLAAKEGKNVLVIFHASWCGWCKKLEASMADPACKNYFYKSFVITYLDILERGEKKNLENAGASEMFIKYAGEKEGVPFFLFFDKKGTLLADSKYKPAGAAPDKAAQNIGCPTSDEEVAAFIKILKGVSKISEQEAVAVTERFKKNR